MRNFFYFFLLIFIFLYTNLIGQETYSYIHYTTNDGLSGSTIYAIHQDSYGFMWFGSDYGLSKYDGYSFTNFIHDNSDSTSISENNILDLKSDKHNNLWVVTQKGIDIFDYNTNTFQHVLQHNKIKNSIFFQANTNSAAYYLDNGQILRFNSSSRTFELFYKDNEEKIQSFFVDTMNNLWVNTLNKFYQYNTSQKKITDKKHLQDTLISDIYRTNFWYNSFLKKGTEISLSKTYRLIKQIEKKGFKKLTIHEISDTKIWFSNYSDFYCFDTLTLKTTKILISDYTSFFIDNNKNIWLGTSRDGLYLISSNLKNIKKIIFFEHNADKITSIYTNNDTILWLTTAGNGIIHYNIETQKQTQITYEYNTYYRTLFDYDKNTIWFGGTGGLYAVNKKNLKINQLIKSGTINFISNQSNNNNKIYIFDNNCLYSFDKDNIHSTKKINLPDKPNYLFKISEKEYWLSSQSGLWVMDSTFKIKQKFTPNDTPKTISNNWISKIIKDKTHKIWIGTANGLDCYDEKTKSFSHYQIKDGLPSNVIMGIEIDDNNNLWLSTNNGISFFDRKTKTITNYEEIDNLQGKNFMKNCSFKSSSGQIYFGGVNGLNYFVPQNIIPNNRPPRVQITDFKIFNRSVSPSSEGILTQNILNTTKIILPYHQNSFSFHFVALNYILPEKNQYAYRLIGFENDTNYIDNHRTAVYTNIPPGNYTFCVMASNNDKVWNYQGRKITLIITPPFWQTWWFRTAMFLFVIGAIVLFYLKKINQIKHQNALLEQKVKKRTQKLNETIKELKEQKQKTEQKNKEIQTKNEKILHQNEEIKQMIENLEKLNRAKIQFFTNISHEFRTPLSLILAPVEKIMKLADQPEIKQQLKLIYRNAKKLSNLINELLYFRKIEAGKMQIHFSKNNIQSLLNEISENFTPLMQKKNIEFTRQLSPNNTEIYIAPQQFDKIITNLLSNAYKFTPENGKISLTLNSKNETSAFFPEGYCQITIKDTGKGIKRENLDKIFNQFYQIDTYQTLNELKSSGIGLALTKQLVELHHGKIDVVSQENKGTEFTIKIPVGKKHLTKNELVEKTKYQKVSTALLYDFDDYEIETRSAISNNSLKSLIMIVEDNDEIRQFLQTELENEYQIIAAENGKKALHLIEKQMPELIISDVMMPEMNGIEFCKKIKTSQTTSHIPVILLTAKASIENQLEGFETGADAYISKPFYLDLLKIRIRNLLHNREIIRQKYQDSNEIIPKNITTNKLDNVFLEQAVKIIEKNIRNEKFTNTILFQELGMSKSAVYQKLKALTGESVSNFVKTIRLKKAKELLSIQKTVSEVAYEIGFDNLSYFSTSFKEQFGITPSQYLKTTSTKI